METQSVLFTGIAGTDTRNVLRALRAEILRQHSDSHYRALADDPDHSIARVLVNQYCVEDGIADSVGMETFLTDDDKGRQRRRWKDSFFRTLEAINRDRPGIALVSSHLAFQRVSHIFSPLAWRFKIGALTAEQGQTEDAISLFRSLNPVCCVNLIDDIYSVKRRIKPGTVLRLREIITWRQIESFLTDLLAKSLFGADASFEDWPYEYSPVFAVKHPPLSLFRLLFRPNIPRVYACIPVSDPRKEAVRTGTARVEAFVRTLQSEFTVFSPLTIDEKPLELLPKAGDKTSIALDFSKGRWPPFFDDMLSSERPADYPIELNVDEISELSRQMSPGGKSEISRHVRERDYRLIDQADCLAVYRIMYKGSEPSSGMYAEVIYAKGRKPCYYVLDPSQGDSTEVKTLQAEPDVILVGEDGDTLPRLTEKLRNFRPKRRIDKVHFPS